MSGLAEIIEALEPLFTCPECNGERMQTYPVYVDIDPRDMLKRGDEPVYEELRTMRTQCRTCNGTGKA